MSTAIKGFNPAIQSTIQSVIPGGPLTELQLRDDARAQQQRAQALCCSWGWGLLRPCLGVQGVGFGVACACPAAACAGPPCVLLRVPLDNLAWVAPTRRLCLGTCVLPPAPQLDSLSLWCTKTYLGGKQVQVALGALQHLRIAPGPQPRQHLGVGALAVQPDRACEWLGGLSSGALRTSEPVQYNYVSGRLDVLDVLSMD